jgi:hypothetical protein
MLRAQQKMRSLGLLVPYTNTRDLTNSQRVSIDLLATGPQAFAVGKRLYFRDGYNLNFERITGIRIDTSNSALAIDPQTGKLAPSYNNLAGCILYLKDKAGITLAQLPLTDLDPTTANGKITRVDFKNINIGASYIEVLSAAGLDSRYALPFTFYFK